MKQIAQHPDVITMLKEKAARGEDDPHFEMPEQPVKLGELSDEFLELAV